jgi:hypothetical protein
MILATPDNWLVRLDRVNIGDMLTIYPRGSLDSVSVKKAMKAQGFNMTTEFRVEQHGSKIWVQRLA